MRSWAVFAVIATAVCAGPAAAVERVQVGAFWIDRTEVTVAAFRGFVEKSGPTKAERDGGGYEYAAGWEQRPGWSWKAPFGAPAADREPAAHVSWHEADAYCRSIGGRLPTRAEWTEAAYTERRAIPTGGFETGKTYRYPVGETGDGMNNNRRRHVEVATTKQGVNGLYDMGANVWEWLADRRGGDALTAGGSWWYGPSKTQVSGMQWKPADFTAVYIGFRCAYDQATG
jgi:sulfatase modifying factor 1